MGEYESSNKRIARNTLMLYIRMGVSMIISLYTARVVLSTLGDINFGIFNVVSGCVAIFTFLNGALSGSASRYLTYELGRNDFRQLAKTFSATLVVHVALALVLTVLCETIGLWLLESKLIIPADRMSAARWAYQISIIMMVVSIIQVPYGAIVIAREKMDVYAYLSILDIVLRLLLVYLLQILPGDKLILWSILVLFVSVVYTGIYIIYSYRKFPETHIKFHKETPLYKRLLSYAWWDLIGNVSGMLQGQGVNMLLNLFFGPVVNAARAISYQIQGTLTQFSNNFMLASRPQIIKLYAANKIEEMMYLVKRSSCLAFYLSWILTLPLSLELETVLKLWLGSYPEYTVSFTLLTLILGLVLSIKSARVAAIHATGKIKLTNIVVGIILCMVFPVAYILLKKGLSPNAVIIATIIVTLISEVVAIIILRKYIVFSVTQYFVYVYGRCFVVAILSCIIPIVVRYNMDNDILRFTCVCVSSIISVAIVVYIIGIDKTTRQSINQVLKRFVKK